MILFYDAKLSVTSELYVRTGGHSSIKSEIHRIFFIEFSPNTTNSFPYEEIFHVYTWWGTEYLEKISPLTYVFPKKIWRNQYFYLFLQSEYKH